MGLVHPNSATCRCVIVCAGMCVLCMSSSMCVYDRMCARWCVEILCVHSFVHQHIKSQKQRDIETPKIRVFVHQQIALQRQKEIQKRLKIRDSHGLRSSRSCSHFSLFFTHARYFAVHPSTTSQDAGRQPKVSALVNIYETFLVKQLKVSQVLRALLIGSLFHFLLSLFPTFPFFLDST